ncbi:type I-E CRISPR-associated endonuclease Cas1 [Sesbania bispinosa]|nr:type I-E CRISPR-associated endonuclease Cas1 [Sesbania bispinosa]
MLHVVATPPPPLNHSFIGSNNQTISFKLVCLICEHLLVYQSMALRRREISAGDRRRSVSRSHQHLWAWLQQNNETYVRGKVFHGVGEVEPHFGIDVAVSLEEGRVALMEWVSLGRKEGGGKWLWYSQNPMMGAPTNKIINNGAIINRSEGNRKRKTKNCGGGQRSAGRVEGEATEVSI